MTQTPTADELREAIARAIGAHDFTAAIDLLRYLIGVDPHAAAEVYEEIQVGLRMNRGDTR